MSECQRRRKKLDNSLLQCVFSQKTLLLFMAVALMVSTAQDSVNHIPLKTDGVATENFMDARGAHHYKVKIPDHYAPGKDLVLTVKGTEARSDPDLYISSSNEVPSSRNDSEYSCAMVGEDICTIPSSALSPGKIFYVTTKCYRKCGYALSATLLSEIPIRVRKDYKIVAKSGEKRIFTFKNMHQGVRDIKITARANDTNSGMRMYVKEGEEGVPSSSDMGSSDSWENGIIVKLSNHTIVKVSEGQTYKILFEADDLVHATIRVDLVYRDKTIKEGEVNDDFVYFNEKSCYKYKVQSSDKKLRIGAYSFSGNPDIYVTPEPDNIDDIAKYKFNATEPSDDVLVLTPKDRMDVGQIKGWYHICVLGHSPTSYRLRVVESNESYFLEDGIAETNEITTGEKLSFYYTDAALSRDLNITFTLSTHSGPIPKMYAKFCGRVNEEQCSISNTDSSEVVKSVNEHGELYSFLRHAGSSCKKSAGLQTIPCLYVIQVENPKTFFERTTHFSLVAHHNETSYIKLREGIAIDNIVENKQIRYFRFVNRDNSVQNVTFTLKSHHGDADMFVSTLDKFPDNKNFEKKSTRSSKFADEVIFSKTDKKGSLLGIYYIGVQGFEYSSYSIRATLNRESGSGDNNSSIVPIQIREGVSHNEFLHGKDDKKYFRFRTNMRGDAISDIRISLTASTGDYKYYVKSGSLPTTSSYDYASLDASDIIMRREDDKFHAIGNKFILVVPNTKYGTFPKQGRFSLKYTTQHSVQSISKDIPVHGNIQIGEYGYYNYHSLSKVDELTISLTPLSGESNLVVSIDPENRSPTTQKNDYHSAKIGKDSITIEGRDLFQNNPSCNPREVASHGSNPCEIFIGVQCVDSTDSVSTRANDSCSYSLKVYPQFGGNHLLHDGIPQKDHVKQTQVLSYYMPLDTNKDNLYIAANAELGDIKVFTSFADHDTRTDDVENPTKDKNDRESKEVGHSQMIHFTRKEVRDYCKEFEDCMLLISVEGTGAIQYNEFSLTAYYHLRRLIPNSPSFAVVEKDTMAYFSYRSYCDECTVFLSAAPFAIDSDIDMYLNIGAEKDLPTADQYDIKRDEWFTEHIELDTEHEFYKKNGIDSMQNTILIGIYAKETSIVYIDAEESKSRMKTLTHGKGVLIDQEGNEQKFFQYIHRGDTSMKFELTGLHGEVDMRINCYNPHELDRPMNSYLPQDHRTSKWESNSKENTSIVIENEDDEYCSNGVYLISITSRTEGAKYTLEVQRGDTFTNKVIKVGVPIKDQIADSHEKQYMFVLDKQKPFKVTASIYSGAISFSIGKTKDFTSPVMHSEDDHLVIDDLDVKEFHAGENVYIRVSGEYDHSEFILVVTHDDSYSIVPDGFTQTYAMDPFNDDGIRLMYYPPGVEHEMKIQLNGYSDGVGYFVKTKKEYLFQIRNDKLAFPYYDQRRSNRNSRDFKWDTETRQYFESQTMKAERDDPYVILMTIVPLVLDENLLESKEKVKISVNINSHQMNILSPNIPQEVTLSTQLGDYSYFKFFANGHKDIEINLIPCMCMTEMFVFKSYENALQHSNSVGRTHQMVNGMKTITLEKANGPYFLMVRNDVVQEWEESRKGSPYCAFQVVFYDKTHPNYKYSIDNYYPQNEGIMEYDWPRHGELHLHWGYILKENRFETEQFSTIGVMYAFKEKSAFANSVCGLKHHIARQKPLYIERGMWTQDRTYDIREMPEFHDQQYITFYFLASVNRDGGSILYQPVTVAINIGWVGGIPWFLIFSVLIVLGALAYGVYYFKNKADDTQSKLDFEMNDIRNVARVPYADDTLENQSLN